jgi:hypothetical protein
MLASASATAVATVRNVPCDCLSYAAKERQSALSKRKIFVNEAI